MSTLARESIALRGSVKVEGFAGDAASRTLAATNRLVRRYVSKKSRPVYDSVVVAGGGIGALAFAARLARSDEFRGKVTVVAPPVKESRRLVPGVNLRGTGADYLCAALGCDHDTLLKVIGASQSGKPSGTRITIGMTEQDASGAWQFTDPGCWEGGHLGNDSSLCYGIRNTRLVAGLRELMEGMEFVEHHEMVKDLEHLRTFALGKRPLFVNGTESDKLLGSPGRTPKNMMAAVQAPFRVGAGGLRAPLESMTCYAPFIYRDGRIDVGFFTPLSDPLSPDATWYGIYTKVLPPQFDKEHELSAMSDELIGVGHAMGLELVDPEETFAKAVVPGYPHVAPPRSAPGTLELKQAYTSGSPCFYADGMTCAALGGLVAAEAVLNGDDPDEAVRKAIRPYRFTNWILWHETTTIARLVPPLLRHAPRLAMYFPHTVMHLWESAV